MTSPRPSWLRRASAIAGAHAGPTVIRIVPPLTISPHELERGATILAEVLA